MKTALILAYDFPPYVSVGGLRPLSWYKHLHEFGVLPVVITRQWNNAYGNELDYIAAGESPNEICEKSEYGLIIRAPYKPNLANRIMLKYGSSKFVFIRKAVSAYYEFAQFVKKTGPKSSIYYAAKNYLKHHSVDVIIATGDPFILFSYASQLSKEFGIPWLADYRDPWSQKLNIQSNFILRNWHNYFERKIVSTSHAVITVSDFLKHKISKLVKAPHFYVLPNGYEPDAFKNIQNIQQGKAILSIAFVGTIYMWHPLRSFLNVVSEFISSHKEARLNIHFFGVNLQDMTLPSSLEKLIANEFPVLSKHILVHKKMSNDLLLKELAQQNVLLLFNDYSILGTKIFDYIGLKRNVLFCYANDTESAELKRKYYLMEETVGISGQLQQELLLKTNAGYIIQDAAHLLKKLKELYEEFEQKGYIENKTIHGEDYSRLHQINKLAEIINDLRH
jgi:hypothetical protein